MELLLRCRAAVVTDTPAMEEKVIKRRPGPNHSAADILGASPWVRVGGGGVGGGLGGDGGGGTVEGNGGCSQYSSI